MAMKSILFSLYQHFRTLPFRDAVADTFYALRGIIRALRKQTGDQKVITELRNDSCPKCPFYDAKWKTCGTPGETMRGHADGPFADSMKIGCWCYLPLANRDPKKDCWSRAHGIIDGVPIGWPDALRPSPLTVFQEG